jgi:hypothetical protein
VISGFEPWVSHPGLVHAPKNVFDSQYFKVEAPGVEDGRPRGQERTRADNSATLQVVDDRRDGQEQPPADSDCSTVANALREARDAWERDGDARRLRLRLLEVLQALDNDGTA